MGRKILLIFSFFVSLQSFSQVGTMKVDLDQIIPKSTKEGVATTKVIVPNLDSLFRDLEANIQNKDLEADQFTFGKFVKFNLNFSALESICKSGECIKEIEIELQGVNTLGFFFKKIYLSKSAKFYIINDEQGYVQGPLTEEALDIQEGLISALMPGDKLRLVLIESEKEKDVSEILIDEASFGIVDFFGINNYSNARLSAGPCYNCSASCNQDINCVSSLSLESKAVALILVRSSSSGGYLVRGTGALINNGNQNLRPLFITAAHNYNDTWDTNAQFMFHYRSPQCSPTSNGPTTLTVQGANNLAPGHGPTDLKLVELKTNPGIHPVFSANPVSYLGWSIIDEIKPVNGIHHPLGDVQKYFSGTNVQIYNESIGTGNYFYWKFDLVNGVFQPVSSGSPILNDSKRLISALRGRLSSADPYACGSSNVDAIGGRLSAAWNVFCQYLDPSNEGIVAINTMTSTAGSKIFPSVNGPNLVCSNSIFTLQNAPLDLIITWTVTPSSLFTGATSGSGTTATLTPSGTAAAQAALTYTITTACGNTQISKSILVNGNGPQIYEVPFTLCPQQPYFVFGSPSVDGYYHWDVAGGTIISGQGTDWLQFTPDPLVPPGTPNTLGLTLTVHGSCGNPLVKGISIPVNPCDGGGTGWLVYPNPASEEVTVEWTPQEEWQGKAVFVPYELELYDSRGGLVRSLHVQKEKTTLDIRNLKKGFYYLHIRYKEGLIRRQIRVER